MNFLIASYVFILGLIFGSFFNVVILRLPKGESLSKENSHCPKCGHRIKAYDLIPVLSYLFLGGRCRHCHTPISMRYPLVELITALLFTLVYLTYGFSYQTLIGLFFMSILVIIAVMDIDTMEIMDRFQVLILILALINLFLTNENLINHVIAFFIISVPFFIIAHFFGAMGGGDVKLVAVSGLLLGLKSTLVGFFIASLTGGIVAMFLLIKKQKERTSMMAFGPYLCIGFAIAYLYGDILFVWYLNLFA